MLEPATPGDTIHFAFLDDDGNERQVSGTLLRTYTDDHGDHYEIRAGLPLGDATAAYYPAPTP